MKKESTYITKTPLFTEEVSFFTMPNHEHWKEQIHNIIKVEDNKNIHKYTTIPKKEDNVKLTVQLGILI